MTTTPPTAPRGFVAVREAVSDTTQVTHLSPAAPTDSPTLCGLRRFDVVIDGRVVEAADITWTTTNGHHGPHVTQPPCSACWDAYTAGLEVIRLEAAVYGAQPPAYDTELAIDITGRARAFEAAAARVDTLPDLAGHLDELQDQVAAWTEKHHRAGAGHDPLADALIIAEEAGEVARAVLKRAHGLSPDTDWEAQLYDELGDLTIAILSLAANEGWSLWDIVRARWAEVSQR